MTYSQAMQILVDEHEVILTVLDAVERVASRKEAACSTAFYEQALDFLATFADKCHHAKEENVLFPMLEERGIPRHGGPIGCMLHEHDEGRAYLAAIRQALPLAGQGNQKAHDTIRQQALGYVALLRDHIAKENQVLFPMGDRVTSPADREHLLKKFQCREHGPLPPEAHDHYLALAKELSAMSAVHGNEPASCTDS
ncbi:MAG: cation-binding protein [Phycisphaerae bacterium]|nr:cation-binding protein [Phycisphaerae bacterium]